MYVEAVFTGDSGVDIISDKTPDQIMDAAADLIDERGWCTGNFESVSGELCLVGALCMAAYPPSLTINVVRSCAELNNVYRFMQVPLCGISIGGLTEWNDHFCENRYQATELLRSEAKRFREEHSS
jgi:hypothetical protein